MKPTKQLHLFSLYFSLHIRIYLLFYLFISAGLLIVVTAIAYIITYSQPDAIKNFLNSSYWDFVNIGGMIITTSAYSIYSKKNSRIHLLMLPVSTWMRFLTIMLLTIPLFLIYISAFLTLLYNSILFVFSAFDFIKPITFNPFHPDCIDCNETFLQNIIFFLVLQSVFLMIGSFFPRLGFLKSTGIILAGFISYLILKFSLMGSSLESNFIPNFYAVMTNNTDQCIQLRKLIPGLTFIWHSLWIMIIPVMWYTGYLQIREMEV